MTMTTTRTSDDDFAVFRETDTGFHHVGYTSETPVVPESIRRRFSSVESLCAAEDRKRALRLALLTDLPEGVWLGGVA